MFGTILVVVWKMVRDYLQQSLGKSRAGWAARMLEGNPAPFHGGGQTVQRRRGGRLIGAVFVLFFLLAGTAAGHAILVESSPAANAEVHGPDITIHLRYNSRIDGSRSRLTLVRPDGSKDSLKIEEQSSPNTLTSKATGLKPGSHQIQWQVLAADGHITRGVVAFTVAGK